MECENICPLPICYGLFSGLLRHLKFLVINNIADYQNPLVSDNPLPIIKVKCQF